MKICSTCKIEQDLSSFNKDMSRKDKLHSICKSCHSKRNKARRLDPTFREKYLAQGKLFRLNYPDKYKASVRNSVLFAKYGIRQSDYEAMLAKQNGACAICCSTESRGYGRFHVDHCHTTGKIRGLLCQGCNTSLGKFKDNIQHLRAAILYLENSN